MKKRRIPSAIPIYCAAAIWLLMGLIARGGMLKLGIILLTCVLSAAAYVVAGKIFRGREVEEREKADTGDRELDSYIEAGRTRLESLRAANDAIPDAGISKNLDRMVTAGGKIFDTVSRDSSQAAAVRKFMNYYLPTADKLMKTYGLLKETGSSGENVTHTMKSVENSLDMIATAFEKQLDNLYKDKVLDIDTDIDVLKTMLVSDGLVGNGTEGTSAVSGNF